MQQQQQRANEPSESVSSSSCGHDYANKRPTASSTIYVSKSSTGGASCASKRKRARDLPGRRQEEAQAGCRALSSSRVDAKRRNTLADLIELFEQRARLADQSQQARSEASMVRNIITPVDYQPAESGKEDGELSEDSLDYQHERPRQRSLHRKLTDPNWQPATDWRKYEHLTSASSPNCPSVVGSESRARPVQRAPISGPPIVKHQKSCSRNLLNQLARLRKLDKPLYRIRRPEKVAQVESLIEQLERVATEWQEDERLLDRADLRDWPAQFSESSRRASERDLSSEQEPNETNSDGLYRLSEPMEDEAIERSHLRLAFRTLPARIHRSNPLPFADRYLDDLAVRRLNGRLPSSSRCRQALQMSYLLCTSAYTSADQKTIEEPEIEELPDPDQDDLHYRTRIKTKLDPPEPPFGIPRQPVSHSSASHYLRQQTNLKPDSPSHKRSDSRVSFSLKAGPESPAGRVSADSGLAGGVGSPMSPAPSSALTKRTPFTEQQVSDEDDAAIEIDLAGELETRSPLIADGKDGVSNRPSSALELHQAEYVATPTRRRPRIEVRNPRSKSPLLRVNPSSPARSSPNPINESKSRVQVRCYSDTWQRKSRRPSEELEIRYEFSTDDDDEDVPEVGDQPRVVRTTSPPADSSSNESSIERLQYRAGPKSNQQFKSESPKFTIGEYKSLDRRSDLKIL